MKNVLRGDRTPLVLGEELGRGGEAAVLAVLSDPGLVAKVYHMPNYERVAKLQAMLSNPPTDPTAGQDHVSICWPTATIFDYSNNLLGILMPKIDFKTAEPLFKLYNPKDRWKAKPGFTWRYLLRTAVNISSAIEAIHAKGYVVGDLNESNIMVADTALVTLVDCDSMQVPRTGGDGCFRCPVGKPEYTPPELQGRDFSSVDRSPMHDNFGLAVLIFQLLLEGIHPYAGVCQGLEMTLEERIRRGESPYAGSRIVAPMPIAPPFEILPRELQALFIRCFHDGQNNPGARPDPHEWRVTLAAVEPDLLVCSKNPQHVYGKHLAIYECPWCARKERFGGLDPFPEPGQQVALPSPPPRPPSSRQVLGPPPSAPRTSSSQPRSSTPQPSAPKLNEAHQPVAQKKMSVGMIAAVVVLITGFSLAATYFLTHLGKKDSPGPGVPSATCVITEDTVDQFVRLAKAGPSAYNVTYTMPVECQSGSLTINGDWVANYQKASDEGKPVLASIKVRAGVRIKAAVYSGVEGTGKLLVSKFIEAGGRISSPASVITAVAAGSRPSSCQIANIDDYVRFTEEGYTKDAWTYRAEYALPRDCQKGSLTVEGVAVGQYDVKKDGAGPVTKPVRLGPNARFKVALVNASGTALASKMIETKPAPSTAAAQPDNGVYTVGGDVTAPKIVLMPAAVYTDKARQARIEGAVAVDVVVGADGKVHDPKVFHSLGSGLDENAMEAVLGATIHPATRNGQPVAVHYRMNVNFMLPPPAASPNSYQVVHEHILGLVGQGCTGRLIFQGATLQFESDKHPGTFARDKIVSLDTYFPAFTMKDKKHWKFHVDTGRKEREARNAELMKALSQWYHEK